jgi:hypothetical protein
VDTKPVRIFATKQPIQDSIKQSQEHTRSTLTPAEIRSNTISPLSTGMPLIQRQCACGGGCPRCQDNLTLQTKLKIGEQGDVYEQEADRVADEVMRMPEPTIQRQMEPEEDVEEMVQMKAISNSITPLQRSATAPNQAAEVPDIVHDVLRSPGQSLDSTTRALMEPRFGTDFSQVRVHTGGDADRSAKDVNAKAYTVQQNIVFRTGKYAPNTQTGLWLLAHELTHVVQNQHNFSKTDLLHRKEEDAGACGNKSLVNGITSSDKLLNGKPIPIELSDKDFGNTSKFPAYPQFGACKVGNTWRFQLDAIVLPVGSRIQDINFRKNVVTASDSIVTKQSYAEIIHDLSPTRKSELPVSCSGNKFEDKTTRYSWRNTFWNQQFVTDHEAFHRKNWVDMYQRELIKAENEVWSHSIPESDAKIPTDAVFKASKNLNKYMADAAQRVCKTYAPQQESRAYDAGAPAYQKLVDEIKLRAKKEKW